MHQEYWAVNLICIGQLGRIEEDQLRSQIPAVIGVQGTRMVATLGLVVIVILLEHIRGIIRHIVGNAAFVSIGAILIINGTLGVQLLAVLHAFTLDGGLIFVVINVTVGRNLTSSGKNPPPFRL